MATMPTATQQTVLALYQLLEGRYPTPFNFARVTSYADQAGASALAEALTLTLQGRSDAQLASAMVKNAGIANAGVVEYVAAVLGAFGSAVRGQVVINLANQLAALEGDRNFGSDALRFNQQVAVNFEFVSDPRNLPNSNPFGTPVLTTLPDVLNGGGADDTFRAGVTSVITTTFPGTTLTPDDVLDGGAGRDSLYVSLNGSYAGGARIANIETIDLFSYVQGEAVFDFNAKPGVAEITGLDTISIDRLQAGQALTLNHVLAVAPGVGGAAPLLPTLALLSNGDVMPWGTINLRYREGTTAGSADVQDIRLVGTINATLNLGAGIETVAVEALQGLPSTLAYSTERDSGGDSPHGAAADIVSAGALVRVLLGGTGEIGRRAGIQAGTGLTDRAVGSDLGIGGAVPLTQTATASNLLSVESRVTQVDASGMVGRTPANLRFVARTDGQGTDVAFIGGRGGSYVEFELGNVSARGGAANDTFAFIDSAGSAPNATFGSGDTLVGGAGADTLQLGLNGVGRFDLAASVFANVAGIETLDLRGAANTLALPGALVARADAGAVFTVHTDHIVQTSLADAANAPGASFAEDNAVTVLDLTGLGKGQALVLVGGSGADRVVVNDATATAALRLNGGDHQADNGGAVAGAGDYDTLTLRGGGVLDRADLSNVQGFEALLLARASVDAAGTVFGIELTSAFVRANTAAADLPGTRLDDTVFHIGTATGDGAVPVGAGDTVFLEISDLLGADRATLAAAMAGRGIDVQVGAAQVRYLVDGVAANAAQVALVTKADAGMATRADATPLAQGVELVGLPAGDVTAG